MSSVLAAISFGLTGNAIIDLILLLIVVAILAYFLREFLTAMGIPIPRILLVGIGCIVAILIVFWFASFIGH